MPTITPDPGSSRSKTQQVREMFDRISGHYDFLNHFLSWGIDVLWRKKLVKIAQPARGGRILDIATGTGDQAIMLAEKLAPQRIDAVDLSEKMMDFGREKVRKKGLEEKIFFQRADCQSLPFGHNTFDLATVSFGVRNFENLAQSLSEIHRVLKPGGMLLILEFSYPTRFPIRQLYTFYTRYILPAVGRIVSHDAPCVHLPAGVHPRFPGRTQFHQHSACGRISGHTLSPAHRRDRHHLFGPQTPSGTAMTLEVQLRLTPSQAANADLVREAACRKARIASRTLNALRVLRRSIDARAREPMVEIAVAVYSGNDFPQDTPPVEYPDVREAEEILIVGSGPAGMFAALKAIECGYRPIVLERGKDVHARRRDIKALCTQHIVDPDSNYCFGEGGAGTYSDGKLYTRSKKRGRHLGHPRPSGTTRSVSRDHHRCPPAHRHRQAACRGGKHPPADRPMRRRLPVRTPGERAADPPRTGLRSGDPRRRTLRSASRDPGYGTLGAGHLRTAAPQGDRPPSQRNGRRRAFGTSPGPYRPYPVRSERSWGSTFRRRPTAWWRKAAGGAFTAFACVREATSCPVRPMPGRWW